MATGELRFAPYGAIVVAHQNGGSGALIRRTRSDAALR